MVYIQDRDSDYLYIEDRDSYLFYIQDSNSYLLPSPASSSHDSCYCEVLYPGFRLSNLCSHNSRCHKYCYNRNQ